MVAQFVVAVWCCGPVVLSSLVVHASLNNVALYSSFLSLVFLLWWSLCLVFASLYSSHLSLYTWFIAHSCCPSGFVRLNIGAILSVVHPFAFVPSSWTDWWFSIFVSEFAGGKVYATSPFFVGFRFSSFVISCSYMRSDWTEWKDRFYIWEGYEVWAKLEKQGARAERKNGSEEDLSREFRGRWEVYVVVVVIAVWCCVFG